MKPMAGVDTGNLQSHATPRRGRIQGNLHNHAAYGGEGYKVLETVMLPDVERKYKVFYAVMLPYCGEETQ
jgi:hypothetical protein